MASTQLTAGAFAASPAPSTATGAGQAACSRTAQNARVCSTTSNGLELSLPDGTQPCPASGEAASCAASGAPGSVPPGVASTPDGMSTCPVGDTNSAVTSTPAACNYSDTSNSGTPVDTPSVAPSVPISSLQPAAALQKLTLSADRSSVRADTNVLLTANAGGGVRGAGVAIEIFDTSSGALVGACAHGTTCSVFYQANGGVRDFVAYLTVPTATVPGASAVSSNKVSVGWIGLTVNAVNAVVGPGKAVTVTAVSSVAVERFGYAIEMFDLANMSRITYCSRGTNCTVSLTQQSSGTRSIVAAVGKPTAVFSNPDIWGVSDHFSMTWLSVSMGGTSAFQVGGLVHLNASANADLTNTPWSIGLFDDQGHLVGKPCKSGSSCAADVAVTSSVTPHFFAAIGAVPPERATNRLVEIVKKVTGPVSLTNIQARSATIQPTRILWGVDSCKAFTGDVTGEVYPGVAGQFGAPDFWGRYLTSTVCPGLSWPEIYAAQKMHMGILPIYNEYNCSAVVGYDTGVSYAQAAVSVAEDIRIPHGRVLAIDIEPPGAACPGAANVDSGFIRGWYDGVHNAGYVPVFYGSGIQGSEFASAWCDAQSQVNQISRDSYIWSFEPSLISQQWTKSNAPVWQPEETGCPDNVAAWQYQLGGNSANENVDGDEVLSTLPLWYP